MSKNRGALVFLMLFSVPFTFALPITECGMLDEDNVEYTLSQDISSLDGCFSVEGTGITMDCQGHTISYGLVPTIYDLEHAFLVTGDGFTLRDCTIKQRGITSSVGVVLVSSHNEISGVTITTVGKDSKGPVIKESSHNHIHDTTITSAGYGIVLNGRNKKAKENTIIKNTISSSSTSKGGILFFSEAFRNTVQDNVITAESAAIRFVPNGDKVPDENTLMENGVTSHQNKEIMYHPGPSYITHLFDQPLTSINFAGNTLSVGKTGLGHVTFSQPIDGRTTSFDKEIIFSNNKIMLVDFRVPDLDQRATVELYAVDGSSLVRPTLLKNYGVCDECAVLTELTAEVVSFTIPGSGIYSIGDPPFSLASHEPVKKAGDWIKNAITRDEFLLLVSD